MHVYNKRPTAGVGSWVICLILIIQPHIRDRVTGAIAPAGGPRIAIPGLHWPTLAGDTEAFQGQCLDIISPPSPGSSPGSPPQCSCPEHLPWEAPSGHPYLMNHLDWLPSKQSSGSNPSSSPLAELLTLSLREATATLLRKPISAHCTRNLVLSVINHPLWP